MHLPIILAHLVALSFASPIDVHLPLPASSIKDTNRIPAIPENFNVIYSSGPGDPMQHYPVTDAFLSILSTLAEKPYNDDFENEKTFDKGTGTIRLSIFGLRFRLLLVKEAMWAYYLCFQQVSRGGPGGQTPYANAGCEIQRDGQKIGFLRVYYKERGVSDEVEEKEAQEKAYAEEKPGIKPAGENLPITARDGGEEVDATRGVTALLRRFENPRDVGEVVFPETVFEALIDLAAKTLPRTENPYVRYDYASQGLGMRLELRGEDTVGTELPPFYNVVVRGLDALVREVQEKGGRWEESNFEFWANSRKIYGGSLTKAPGTVETA